MIIHQDMHFLLNKENIIMTDFHPIKWVIESHFLTSIQSKRKFLYPKTDA